MRRLLYISIALLCLCSCKDKATTFVLEGRIDGLANDTIYIYGADALFENVDMVVAKNGEFRYTATIDTVTPLWILFPNKHREMIFADKKLKATIQGDIATGKHLRIEGGAQNELLQQFYNHTDKLTYKEITVAADSFIRANPYSEVSVHLLREYFVHQLNPDPTKIKALIGSMSGNLRDNNYIKQLQQTTNAYKPLAKNTVISHFSIKDSIGENISSTEYKESYLLINFWASWDEESRIRQRELVAIKEKYKEHDFDILSISLDTDRDAWLQAMKEDSVTWRQGNDFDGWKNGVVQRLQISHLPSNLLINTQRRIQAIDLYGEELDTKIGELTTPKSTVKEADKKTPSNIRNIKATR